MTKLTPTVSSQKTLTVALQSPQETLQATPTLLPTSEPSSGNEQISYTVQPADLPTFNMMPSAKMWVAHLYAAGKFTSSGSLYYRMKKNGVNVANGSGTVNSNLYYTRLFCFYNVQVGDVLKISLWSNRSDSDWDYNAYSVYPTRVWLSGEKRALLNVAYADVQAVALTLGVPRVSSAAVAYSYHDDQLTFIASEGQKIALIYNGEANDYGFFRVSHGDYTYADSSPTHFTDSTYRPVYWREEIPTTVSFREIEIPAL